MKKCSNFKGKTLRECPPGICKINRNNCILNKNKTINEFEEDKLILEYLAKRESQKQNEENDLFIIESEDLEAQPIQLDVIQTEDLEAQPIQLDVIQIEDLEAQPIQLDVIQIEDLEAQPIQLDDLIDIYKSVQNFCIFGNKNDVLTTYFDNYTIPNVSILEKTHMCIGSGRNGFQVKVVLSKNEISNEILLKSSNPGNNDNLIYEYLVGLCVNKLCLYFPIFCKTYGVCKYKNNGFVNLMKSKCLKFGDMIWFENDNNINNYLENLNIQDLEQSIINGCTHRQELCLSIQYYESTTLYKLFNYKFSIHDIPLVSNLITILHFVYEGLDKLKDMFTHYDLHTDNVLVYTIPNDNYVEIIYHDDTSKEYHVKSKYIPIIIDYGHSFINCDEIDRSISNSNQIFTTVCNNDRNSGNPVCDGVCGWDSGFFYNDPPNKGNYYICSRTPNRSHDLKLLKSFRNETNLNAIKDASPYLQEFSKFLNNVIFEDQYGTPELNTRELGKINNVEQAAEGLRSIIQMPTFIEQNEIFFIGKKKYGTLHIWVDQLKQFEFTLD